MMDVLVTARSNSINKWGLASGKDDNYGEQNKAPAPHSSFRTLSIGSVNNGIMTFHSVGNSPGQRLGPGLTTVCPIRLQLLPYEDPHLHAASCKLQESAHFVA